MSSLKDAGLSKIAITYLNTDGALVVTVRIIREKDLPGILAAIDAAEYS